MADDFKRNGGLIPKVRPGQDTANYLDDILSKITLPGVDIFIYLCSPSSISAQEAIVQTEGLFPFFWGTSLLIMVGV